MVDHFAADVAAGLDDLRRSLAQVDPAARERLTAAVLSSPRIFLAGAGRSGLVLRAAAMRFVHLGLRTFLVGDTVTPALGSGDLLIIGSGSGETSGLLSIADRAKTLGATLAVVTGSPKSALAGRADILVIVGERRTDAPPPRQVMGGYFEQSLLLLFDTLVLELMRRGGQSEADMFARHANLE